MSFIYQEIFENLQFFNSVGEHLRKLLELFEKEKNESNCFLSKDMLDFLKCMEKIFEIAERETTLKLSNKGFSLKNTEVKNDK